MASEGTERRLAAIMFTDIVGYTALMGADESRALDVVDRSRRVIRERVEAHAGRFAEFEGDGTLSTFPSAVEAVACARELQDALREDADITLRIGIHVGDVLEAEGHIYGDGVNVAARIRELSRPGGICVSDGVYAEVRNKPGIGAHSLGTPELKNVNRPIAIWALEAESTESGQEAPLAAARRRWPRRAGLTAAGIAVAVAAVMVLVPDLGYRLAVAAVFRFGLIGPPAGQEIASTTSADGTRIAWASIGSGPPVVQVQVWSTNLELGPICSPEQCRLLAERHRYVYYDGRGFGLSQRGVVHSHEARVADLEAVVDAAGLERTALWGISGGAPVAISYAARHPDRVTRVVLYGARLGLPPGMLTSPETVDATITLVREHWGRGDRAFQDFFRSLFVPDASEFQLRIFDEFMRRSGTGEEAAAFLESELLTDVSEEAPHIRAPVLMIHRRDDRLIPFEAGLEAASVIPNARFLALEGQNHVFLPGEAEGEQAFEEVLDFFSEDD